MLYSSILSKLTVFVQLSTQIQTHSSYFVRIQAQIYVKGASPYHIKGNFKRSFVKIIPQPKIFSQMPFVTFVTNSTSC